MLRAFLLAVIVAGALAVWPVPGLPIACLLITAAAWRLAGDRKRGRSLFAIGFSFCAISFGVWVPFYLAPLLGDRLPYGFAETPRSDWAAGAFFVGLPLGIVGFLLWIIALILREDANQPEP